MSNSTELDLSVDQDVEVTSESIPVNLSSLELDLVGGGGAISIFL